MRRAAETACVTDNGFVLSCLYVENPFSHSANAYCKWYNEGIANEWRLGCLSLPQELIFKQSMIAYFSDP